MSRIAAFFILFFSATCVKAQNCIPVKDSIGYSRIASAASSTQQLTFSLGPYEKCRYVKIRLFTEAHIVNEDGANLELQMVDSAGVFDQQSRSGRYREMVTLSSEYQILMEAFREKRITAKSFANTNRVNIRQLKVELIY